MKALILRGHFRGFICEVSQWCNDWFTLDPSENTDMSEEEKIDIMRQPFSPSSLAFTAEGMQEIKKHKNNGILFGLFEPTEFKPKAGKSIYRVKESGIYLFTFKRRKYDKQ